jgi:hypothetical protein
MAGRAILQLQEFSQELLFGFGEQRHVHGTLAATQDGAQGDDQQGVEIMQPGALPLLGSCTSSKQAAKRSKTASIRV